MFKLVDAFSGFSVDDLVEAKKFYGETLGLEVKEDMGLNLNLPGGQKVFIYPKENHQPATYTVLNLVVDDLDASVDELISRGVKFEQYEGMHQNEKGIARPPEGSNYGPPIAWFKDPAGNVLALIEK
ncbi:MAG: glyoxalase [Candidatus Saccharibacteria bacterium]|nr:glyoxalase [Candidatus Saccharibacteria bacterium]